MYKEEYQIHNNVLGELKACKMSNNMRESCQPSHVCRPELNWGKDGGAGGIWKNPRARFAEKKGSSLAM